MRYLIIALISVVLLGCGNNDNTSNAKPGVLVGAWVSNCHELRNEATNELLAYVVVTYQFNNASYTLDSISYDDLNCSIANGDTDNWTGNYSIGEEIISTDGLTAIRISSTERSAAWPQSLPSVEIERIFRIRDDELNFGLFVEGVIPEIFYSITYVKNI